MGTSIFSASINSEVLNAFKQAVAPGERSALVESFMREHTNNVEELPPADIQQFFDTFMSNYFENKERITIKQVNLIRKVMQERDYNVTFEELKEFMEQKNVRVE